MDRARFTSFELTEATGTRTTLARPGVLPDISDLSARVRFSPEEGHIWLGDQRALLLNIETFVSLRRQLIEAVGPRRAREIFFRMGHAAGNQEARLAREAMVNRPQIDAFLVGPQLHALRGEVYVEPVVIRANVETGEYFSELIWRNSAEAEVHLAAFGGSSEPICWMQLGYASGYTSAIMERSILFHETECVGCGDQTCRIVGRPVEEWPDEHGRQFEPYQLPTSAAATPLDALGRAAKPVEIVGTSPGFLGAWHLLQKVAPFSTTVLLLGETGVGKEIFARAIHAHSPRSRSQFFSVNCAAISESLLDAELFGVERGAFTGAHQSRPGWFEVADGSTLFLDEVGTLSPTAQAKLLRVLQERQLTRVGSTKMKDVDVRLICATNLDLDAEVRAGRFREDLLHRLNVLPIKIPPLRERHEDIPLLVEHFLTRFAKKSGYRPPGFTVEAIDALIEYEFPGNVRELENMIERAAILSARDEPITSFHLFRTGHTGNRRLYRPARDGHLVSDTPPSLPPTASSPAPAADLNIDQLERNAIEQAMTRSGGNVSKAAKLLGVTRARLRYRLHR
jgi:DNA-binding NtrC family response regulator